VQLVPKPVSVRLDPGTFVLPANLAIEADPEHAAIVRRLLGPGTGLDLPTAATGDLKVMLDRELPAEGYRLSVTPTMIRITSADAAGVNWAVQTLRQLLPPAVLRPAPSGVALEIPCVTIHDHPRFAWRGVMIDVGRHFMPLSDLFGTIDLLALHKYNVIHLHLSEDQGWRFQSHTHPRLEEVASWRSETRRPGDDQGDGTPHGGIYTQDQLRSLVAYAEQRGVAIVPELEFPGHVLGVLSAYPELGNHPEEHLATGTSFGVFPQVLSLSDDAMQFVFDLYTELLDVFPSRYIHVGGDECPRIEWIDSPGAQELAAARGLPGPEHLQRWFTEQLRNWLAERGRQLVGWDEINDEGPLLGAVTMAWRDAGYGIQAAADGLDVLMAPSSHTYFDYYPGPGDDEPYAIGGLITTEDAYAFEPLAGMPEASHPRVLGTQCQVWTEYMPTSRRVQYMLFPRACAHSEVAWSSPVERSWPEFQPRLAAHLARLDALGVNYRPENGPSPWQRGGTGAWKRSPTS
jgi:hexosaminidase